MSSKVPPLVNLSCHETLKRSPTTEGTARRVAQRTMPSEINLQLFDQHMDSFEQRKRFGHRKSGDDLTLYLYERDDERSKAFDAYVDSMRTKIESREGHADASGKANNVFSMQLTDTTIKPKDNLWDGKGIILRVSKRPVEEDDEETLYQSCIELWYALQAGVLKIGPAILISGLLSDNRIGMIMERGKYSVHDYLKEQFPQPHDCKYAESLQSQVQKASENGWLLCDINTRNMIITKENEILLIDFDSAQTVVLNDFDAACVEFINLFLLINYTLTWHYVHGQATHEKIMCLKLMGVEVILTAEGPDEGGFKYHQGGVHARFNELYAKIKESKPEICKDLLNIRLEDATFFESTLRDIQIQELAKQILFMAMHYHNVFEKDNSTIKPLFRNVKGQAEIVKEIIGNEFKIPTTPSFRNR